MVRELLHGGRLDHGTAVALGEEDGGGRLGLALLVDGEDDEDALLAHLERAPHVQELGDLLADLDRRRVLRCCPEQGGELELDGRALGEGADDRSDSLAERAALLRLIHTRLASLATYRNTRSSP